MKKNKLKKRNNKQRKNQKNKRRNTNTGHVKRIQHLSKPKVRKIPVSESFYQFGYHILKHYKEQGCEVFFDKNGRIETKSDTGIWEIHKTGRLCIRSREFFIQLSTVLDGIHLHLLKVNQNIRNKGIGTRVLEDLRNISNELNIPIYLIPLPLVGDSVGYKVLHNFYHKNGYKRESDSRYWKYEPNSLPKVSKHKWKLVS